MSNVAVVPQEQVVERQRAARESFEDRVQRHGELLPVELAEKWWPKTAVRDNE